MAQTISIQRGSVTYTADGSTTSNITTLFTNTSSGAGTRVIVNYIVVNNPYQTGGGYTYPSATCSGFLGVVSSGTTGSIIGGMTTSSGTNSTFTMPLGDNQTSVGAGSGTIVASPPRFRAAVANQNQVGYTATNPSNIGFSVSDTTNVGYCPRNFWIGPSDVIKWWPLTSQYTFPSGKGTAATAYTQTLYYSFVCITES